VADAFFVALKLPNLFRRLFGEGAFSAAFIPAFIHAGADGAEEARRRAGEMAAVMAPALLLLVIVGELAMPWLMHGFAPGFVATPARFDLAVLLTRITFPYLMLICLAALLAGVLNAEGRFAAAAATPVLFNVVCIGALLLLRHRLPTAGHALAIGVLAAGFVQLAWIAAACMRAGILPRVVWPRLTPFVRLVLRRMAPGLVGAGVTQLNLAVGVIIASLLPSGTVALLYYADRINQLPLGTIGAALGTTLLPALSRDIASGEPGAARARLNRAIELALGLTLPAALGLLLLAHPIVTVLFERGAFNAIDVGRSATALQAYAAGLPFYVLARLLAPAAFARGDTKGPVVVGAVAVAVNLVLGLALVRPCGMIAPAIATSVAGFVNALLLALMLWRCGAFRHDATLRARLPRLLLATLVMGLVVAALGMIPRLSHPAHGLSRLFGLAALIAAGVLSFAAAAHGFGAIDLWQLRRGLRVKQPGP
jgi:putative peptidoglycan lipid II flippase